MFLFRFIFIYLFIYLFLEFHSSHLIYSFIFFQLQKYVILDYQKECQEVEQKEKIQLKELSFMRYLSLSPFPHSHILTHTYTQPPEVHESIETRPELNPSVDIFAFGILALEVC